jgi:hypothetical protein
MIIIKETTEYNLTFQFVQPQFLISADKPEEHLAILETIVFFNLNYSYKNNIGYIIQGDYMNYKNFDRVHEFNSTIFSFIEILDNKGLENTLILEKNKYDKDLNRYRLSSLKEIISKGNIPEVEVFRDFVQIENCVFDKKESILKKYQLENLDQDKIIRLIEELV